MGKAGLTLGYLSEISFESHMTQMLDGVIKAAREKNVNLTYFTVEPEQLGNAYKRQIDYICNILERVTLDGLMFLGGMHYIEKNESYFLSRIQSIKKMPVVSLGRKIENIPSIIIDSDKHLIELLEHLYNFHGYRNIAFIQPITPDKCYACYEKFMKERGIFDPELVVMNRECSVEKDYFDYKRAKRIVEILFDERKAPIEAVISMYTYEAAHIIQNLAVRGFKVPGDIAVTSWEDGDIGKYAQTPITSVYYPFFEIGYEGCKKTIDLIEGVNARMDTVVPANLNIRNSCGCRPLDELRIDGSYVLKDPIDKYLKIKRKKLQVLSGQILLDIMDMEEDSYLESLEDYIGKTLENNDFNVQVRAINTIRDIQKDILWFYSFINANFSDNEQKTRAEKMALKVLLILKQKTEQVLFYNEALKSGSSDMIQNVGQNILTAYDIGRVNKTLSENMLKIGVMNYFLFFNLNSTSDINLKNMGKTFIMNNGKTEALDKLPDKFDEILFPGQSRHIYYFHILHIKSKLLGFIFFEPSQTDDRIYYNFSIQLSSELYGSIALDKLRSARDKIVDDLKIIRGKTLELEQSNAKLAQQDNLKNEFIANVTHDFRNPLTVILNLADLSLKYPMDLNDVETADRFNTIFSASLTLKHSIDLLLDIARLDASGMKVHIRKIPLKAFIDDIVEFYISAASSSGIRIIKDLPDKEIDEFYSDAEKLDEILNNIMSNAMKFVEPGSGLIKITLKEREGTIRIVIEDNGIGIPRDKLEFIFGRFEQVQSGRKGKNKGTGIGLSFARQLAILLNGSLWAESEGLGKGARFILDLKKGREVFELADENIIFDRDSDIVLADTREYYRQVVRGSIEEKMKYNTFYVTIKNPNAENEFDPFKANIMILDDDIHIHEILKLYLANWGYNNFIHAYNGTDGLEAVYRYRPDLIICDYNMPNMLGNEMQERLMNNPEFRHIPLIFLSAVSDKNRIIKRKEKGTIVYLNKPIEEKELMVNVGYFLMKQMEYKQLLTKSSLDELTGLANIRSITAFLNDHIMMRAYRPLSLIIVDIDNFKLFNNKYGHLNGDYVIVEVGKAVKNIIRNYDRAGRFGGDEFLIVLPETSLKEAGVVAEKIRDSISGLKPEINDEVLNITSSFGVSSLIEGEKFILSKLSLERLRDIFEINDKRNTDWDRVNSLKKITASLLVEMANQALCKAKKIGRNNIELFTV